MTFISVSTIACVYLVHNVDKLQQVNVLAVWMQFTVHKYFVYFFTEIPRENTKEPFHQPNYST